ncbi:MAG: di-trans,poly-cis-decaprenylcistransferase, partial [Elusimicrobia bacterium]|nr:di-trans,poly-cis-decaprenylcistransferase [Elusimicrobiota bacterium]
MSQKFRVESLELRVQTSDSSTPNSQLPTPNSQLPKHIAIIMDGNGRWAKKRHLPRIAGHRAGVKSVQTIVQTCGDMGIQALTLYAFSTENWSRPLQEVGELMKLLSWTLKSEVDKLDKNKVRLMVSGRTQELPSAVREELAKAIRRLENNTGLILNLALNYGARQEILDAVHRILKEKPQQIDEASFSRYLYTAGLPDPDLVIRTSGEMRLSNFLLW